VKSILLQVQFHGCACHRIFLSLSRLRLKTNTCALYACLRTLGVVIRPSYSAIQHGLRR
jgi:hypothetical protein